MHYYCTLFDSYYLNRGLVMQKSLLEKCNNFHLYIFAFDKVSYNILKSLNLQKTTIISLEEFENDDLKRIKPGRTKGEYCWTCTPSTILYCIEKFNLPGCTYLDADLCFYDDPTALIDEMGSNSVLITEHRYTKRYDQSATSGIYCVQFITFKNDVIGMDVLRWWAARCIEWCFNRFEDGKFGDQKYLDDWTSRFKGIHVLRHLGGGVAPWNVQQLDLQKRGHKWLVREKSGGEFVSLIFYHFHHITFFATTVDLSVVYDLKSTEVRRLYREYLGEILRTNKMLLENYQFKAPVSTISHGSLKEALRAKLAKLYHRLFGNYNVIEIKEVQIDRSATIERSSQ